MAYQIGYSGQDIINLQNKLKGLGLYKGDAMGVYDSATDLAYNTYMKGIPTTPPDKVTTTPPKETVVPTVVTPPTTTTTPPVTTTDAPLTYDPTKPFDTQYDPAKDTLLQATLREKNRQIQNAMNRRGIYGSTIMQENLSSADASLLDTYTQLAKQKYDQSVSDRQSAMETAYANAKKRGYYNNDEAALWGVPPGTRISSGTTTTTTTPTTTPKEDGTIIDKNGDIVWSDKQRAAKSVLNTYMNSNPVSGIWWVVNDKNLTQTQKDEFIDTNPAWAAAYEQYIKVWSEGFRFATADQYLAYLSARTSPGTGGYSGELGRTTIGANSPSPSPYDYNTKTWADMDAYYRQKYGG